MRAIGPTYDFDGFSLDPAQHLLLYEGKRMPLTVKAFDVFAGSLFENAGYLIEVNC